MKNSYSDIYILIPTFNPPASFDSFVTNLIELGFTNILIVNDGSQIKDKVLFDDITKKGAMVVSHERNLGKGAALKTGYQFIKKNSLKCSWILACDDDGQHSIIDICKISNIAKKIEQENIQTDLILGCRNLASNIPFKSYIGYLLFKFLFKLFYFKNLSDTQTGLRCIRSRKLEDLIKIPGQRFSYETLCLQYFLKNKLIILEVPIETIYIENNTSTRFKAIKDSKNVIFDFFKGL